MSKAKTEPTAVAGKDQANQGAQDGGAPADVSAQADNGGTDDAGKDEQQDGKDNAQAQASDGKDQGGKEGQGQDQHAASGKSPHTPDWRDGRMAKQADKLRALEAEKADLARQLAEAQQQRPQGQQESDAVFQARVNAEAERRADAIAKNRDWQRQCDETATAGAAAYGKAEFDASVAGLVKLVDMTDKDSQNAYASMLSAAFHTGEAPKLVFMLGQDPNEAARIMSLSPVEQGVALARLAAKDVAKPSAAAKPLTPVASRGGARTETDPRDAASDELTTAEWMARRNKSITEGKARARL